MLGSSVGGVVTEALEGEESFPSQRQGIIQQQKRHFYNRLMRASPQTMPPCLSGQTVSKVYG